MKITRILTARCKCNFTSNLITETRLFCPLHEMSAVTFSAELHGTLTANVYDLISILQAWLAEEESNTIAVLSIEYRVLNLCFAPTTNTNIEEVCKAITSTSTVTLSDANDLGIIVGGAVAVLCVFILAVVSGIVICFIAHSKLRQTPENIR